MYHEHEMTNRPTNGRNTPSTKLISVKRLADGTTDNNSRQERKRLPTTAPNASTLENSRGVSEKKIYIPGICLVHTTGIIGSYMRCQRHQSLEPPLSLFPRELREDGRTQGPAASQRDTHTHRAVFDTRGLVRHPPVAHQMELC